MLGVPHGPARIDAVAVAAPSMRQLAVAEFAKGSEPALAVTLAEAVEDIEIRQHGGEGYGAVVPALEIEQIGDTTS